MQYMSFCVWLLSLSIMCSWSSMLQHESVLHSFLGLNNIPLPGHFTFSLSSLDGPLGCFYFLAFENSTALKFHVQVFTRTHVFTSLGYDPRSGIAVSRGDVLLLLKNICPHKHCISFLISSIWYFIPNGKLKTLFPANVSLYLWSNVNLKFWQPSQANQLCRKRKSTENVKCVSVFKSYICFWKKSLRTVELQRL